MSSCNCAWHLTANRFCPVQNLSMRDAADRLKTFTILNWPFLTNTSIYDFAEAGFYYTGRLDAVRCFLCKVTLFEWENGEKPSDQHKKLSPRCPFVQGQRTYNIPIIASPYPVLPDPPRDYDVPCC